MDTQQTRSVVTEPYAVPEGFGLTCGELDDLRAAGVTQAETNAAAGLAGR